MASDATNKATQYFVRVLGVFFAWCNAVLLFASLQ